MLQITNLHANVGAHPPLAPPASGRGIEMAVLGLPSRLREGLGVGLAPSLVWVGL
jgi:hypothetical protein